MFLVILAAGHDMPFLCFRGFFFLFRFVFAKLFIFHLFLFFGTSQSLFK